MSEEFKKIVEFEREKQETEAREAASKVARRTLVTEFFGKIGVLLVYSAILYWAVLPYLGSVHVLPDEIIKTHNSLFRTFCTILSLRLIWTSIAR